MAEPTTENLLTVTAYGATNRIQQIIDAIRLLEDLHGPRSLDINKMDTRCKTCRNSRGRPEPWPCLTYRRFGELLGVSMEPESVTLFRAIGRWRNGGPTPDWDRLTAALPDRAEQPALEAAP